jgi:hypothetical protein
MTDTSGIEAEDVAALCLLLADGDLACSCADVADLIDATERRARSGFGPVPGVMRQAFAGLVLEAGLATPEELLITGTIDTALARIALGALLPAMLSRDRLWFSPGGVHWTSASPGALASYGGTGRAERLLTLIASRPGPIAVLAALERMGWDRSFISTLLDEERRRDDEDLRRQVSYQDWFE